MPQATGRITRRRSSAGPQPPTLPRGLWESGPERGSSRPTFLTLRDHGKVFVADLPRLSDGQLANVRREATEVLESLNRRLGELGFQIDLSPQDQETRIRATTKRDVTERFLQAIEAEQSRRRDNPALRAAASESFARAFLEIARHRLSGETFDSLLQEALNACGEQAPEAEDSSVSKAVAPSARVLVRVPVPASLPVVLTPDVPGERAAS
jgi:hypothetical protein